MQLSGRMSLGFHKWFILRHIRLDFEFTAMQDLAISQDQNSRFFTALKRLVSKADFESSVGRYFQRQNRKCAGNKRFDHCDGVLKIKSLGHMRVMRLKW